WLSFSVESTRSSARGGLPSPSRVPPPRTLVASRSAWACASARAASSGVAGATNSRGLRPSTASCSRALSCSAVNASVSLLASSVTRSSAPAGRGNRKLPPDEDGPAVAGLGHVDAASRRRQHFAGVAEPVLVPRRLDAAHHVHVGLGEDERHEVTLLDADAVLAGQRAADVGADLQHLGADLSRQFDLARHVAVEQA